MKLPRRIRAQGAVKGRWLAHQSHSRAIVALRAKGVCEGPGCGSPGTEWAHLFGRRHIIEEPWASSPELTAALCRTHHRRLDANQDSALQTHLRAAALTRLSARLGVPIPTGVDQAQAAREMVATQPGD